MYGHVWWRPGQNIHFISYQCIAKYMQEQRHSLKRESIRSFRSRSSDSAFMAVLIEDLDRTNTRQIDLVYKMSIEYEKDPKYRGSDLMRKYEGSARQSGVSPRPSGEASHMVEQTRNLLRKSQGTVGGKHQFKFRQLQQEGQIKTHNCDCYPNCNGQKCECYMSLVLEPCIQGVCCSGCIELKNRRIQAVSLETTKDQTYAHSDIQFVAIIPVKSGCSCKKTRCLKLYCECFSKKGFCGDNCNCEDCQNRLDSDARSNAMVENTTSRSQAKGCYCKKTKCEKKYCACYGMGAKCSKLCQCEGCNNMDQELRVLRNYNVPEEEPLYPPMPAMVPSATLPTQMEFCDYDLPDFAKMRAYDS